MHHIQRKILQKLIFSNTLRYAQMRPAGVESNHFAYHLEQIIREGLVVKNGRDYSFTTKGLALADRARHNDVTIRVQPHIVTSIYLTNGEGQLLLYRHGFQPYIGLYGPPQGRLHYEERVGEAATRELAEKTGLAGLKLQHRGIAYVYTTKQGEDISKLLVHIFSGTVKGVPELAKPTANGVCSWGDVKGLRASECMPGFKEIQKLLAGSDTGLFFKEIEAELT